MNYYIEDILPNNTVFVNISKVSSNINAPNNYIVMSKCKIAPVGENAITCNEHFTL
jgi:hypothetical protein